MTERKINTQIITEQALLVVNRIRETAINHERAYPSIIQAVLVLSGPGTYVDRLKTDEMEWMRYMDRDRIRGGVAVATEVARAKKSFPLLVYNGTVEENRVFRQVFNEQNCKIPSDKTLVIDSVRGKNGRHRQIVNTGDQIESFFQQIEDPDSPLVGAKDVAVVAHIPDFVRIPFYIQKYASESGISVNFYYYGLLSRKGTETIHIQSELEKLVKYARAGYLAPTPLLPYK